MADYDETRYVDLIHATISPDMTREEYLSRSLPDIEWVQLKWVQLAPGNGKAPTAEPTAEQCSAHDEINVGGSRAIAAWYPDMGGYAGKCWIVPDADSCFDVYVWHDGQFPFNGDDALFGHRDPVVLHHCDPDDFTRFAEVARRALMAAEDAPDG